MSDIRIPFKESRSTEDAEVWRKISELIPRRLARYGTGDINYIDPSAMLSKLHMVFHLDIEEFNLLQVCIKDMNSIGRLPYEERCKVAKKMKSSLAKDFHNCMSDNLSRLSSPWKGVFYRVMTSSRDEVLKINFARTLSRSMDFFYMSDAEMSDLSKSLDKMIENAECGLFSQDRPYKELGATGDIRSDFLDVEDNVHMYCDEQDGDIIPKKISAENLIDKLNILSGWCSEDGWRNAPTEFQGFCWVCCEISKETKKRLDSKDLNWLNMYEDCTIKESMVHKKRSGYALNKEKAFREWSQANGFSTWKNPEGSIFAFPTKDKRLYFRFYQGLIFLHTLGGEEYYMDAVYYSLGKGPCMKGRFVGQGVAAVLLKAWEGADLVKDVISRCRALHEKYPDRYPSVDCIDIYRNDKRLEDLLLKSTDLFDTDYTAYSDFLTRSGFYYIMEELWHWPKEYREYIYALMEMPVRIATIDPKTGKEVMSDHCYDVGSVMGIPLNFLLITFSNAIIWILSDLIYGEYDNGIFMGDDVLRGIPFGRYTEEWISITYGVAAYFDCKIEDSKTEWRASSGLVSFCKKTFNQQDQQISGFSGETIWKQTPFLTGISQWINDIDKHQLLDYVSQDDIINYTLCLLPLLRITYTKFYKSDLQSSLSEFIDSSLEIPFQYGGLGYDLLGDNDIDRMWMEALKGQIANLVAEDLEKSRRNPETLKKLNYIAARKGIDHPFYEAVRMSISLEDKLEDLRSYILDIDNVLDNPFCTHEDILKARKAAQIVQQLVLDSESRQINSSSTKNRIDFDFDQDALIKGRMRYLHLIKEERNKKILEESVDKWIDEEVGTEQLEKRTDRYQDRMSRAWMMEDLLDSNNYRNHLKDYMDFSTCIAKVSGRLVWYQINKGESRVAIKLEKYGNLLYRLETSVSETRAGKYNEFIAHSDLSPQDQETMLKLRDLLHNNKTLAGSYSKVGTNVEKFKTNIRNEAIKAISRITHIFREYEEELKSEK